MSIAALGRALRGAVAGDPRGALERAAWTVALRTEAVMRRHCRPLRQVRARPRACARLGPGPSHDLGFTVAPDRRELGRGWGGAPGLCTRADRPFPPAEPPGLVGSAAPSATSRQAEAAPAASPGRRRHLLGEALRPASLGQPGPLARPAGGLGMSLVW